MSNKSNNEKIEILLIIDLQENSRVKESELQNLLSNLHVTERYAAIIGTRVMDKTNRYINSKDYEGIIPAEGSEFVTPVKDKIDVIIDRKIKADFDGLASIISNYEPDEIHLVVTESDYKNGDFLNGILTELEPGYRVPVIYRLPVHRT